MAESRPEEVFGFADLSHRCMNNVELVERVLRTFIESFSKDLENIAKQYKAGDLAGAAKTAHRMKGAAGNAAAFRVQQVSRLVEQAARYGEKQPIPELVQSLEQELNRFVKVAMQKQEPDSQ